MPNGGFVLRDDLISRMNTLSRQNEIYERLQRESGKDATALIAHNTAQIKTINTVLEASK